MSSEKVLTVQAAIRGYHVYKAIWKPMEAETLLSEYEENNPHDLFAIKVCRIPDKTIVGHLPMEISRITKYMIARGAQIEAQLTETHYRRSPLVQGGLEIPCSLTLRMPATVKSSELLKMYLQLYHSTYTEPQENVILGTFGKTMSEPIPASTCSKRKQSRQKDSAVGSRDIRNWLQKGTAEPEEKA